MALAVSDRCGNAGELDAGLEGTLGAKRWRLRRQGGDGGDEAENSQVRRARLMLSYRPRFPLPDQGLVVMRAVIQHDGAGAGVVGRGLRRASASIRVEQSSVRDRFEFQSCRRIISTSISS